MFYDFELEIPKNTSEKSPAEKKVNLTFGVVTHVGIECPPGCKGLAKVRILHRRHIVWPTNIDRWFYSDGRVITWDDYYEMFEPPYNLTLQGYNEDDTFPHSPIFRFEVLPPLVALAKYGGYPTSGIRRIPWEEISG